MAIRRLEADTAELLATLRRTDPAAAWALTRELDDRTDHTDQEVDGHRVVRAG